MCASPAVTEQDKGVSSGVVKEPLLDTVDPPSLAGLLPVRRGRAHRPTGRRGSVTRGPAPVPVPMPVPVPATDLSSEAVALLPGDERAALKAGVSVEVLRAGRKRAATGVPMACQPKCTVPATVVTASGQEVSVPAIAVTKPVRRPVRARAQGALVPDTDSLVELPAVLPPKKSVRRSPF